METELKKRTHVYVQRPKAYEISGCKCGNDDPDWSEYEHRLWCAKCHIDFIPEHDGIFDGPIPVNGVHLLGICLDRVNIKTGQLDKIELDPEMRKLVDAIFYKEAAWTYAPNEASD